MPPSLDCRDHPEKYREGDFLPLNLSEKVLPKKTKINYGDINETVNLLKDYKKQNFKIGFVAID